MSYAGANLNPATPWSLYEPRAASVTSPQFWLWTVVVGLAFFSVDQDPRLLQGETWNAEVYSADEFAERISGGNVVRQAMFLSLGTLGVYGLVRGRGRSLVWNDPLLIACVSFLLLGLASILWSADSGQTMRRAVLLACVYSAALGLVRQLSARDFLRMAFIISAAWFVFSSGLEVALGRFQPWAADYRFRAMMQPNSQGVHCAVLFLASIAMLGGTVRRSWFVRGTLLVAGVALLLTKSRTALLAAVAAVFALRLARPGTKKLFWVLALIMVLAGIALVAGFLGPDFDRSVSDALLLGRTEAAGSLTGRVPLWTALGYMALERPFLGYGYGAFWNPERTEEVADAIYVRGWSIPNAHSSFLDALLALGIFGAAAFAISMGVGLARAAKRYSLLPDAANTFLLALLTFGVVNALAESSVLEPTYFYFLMICAVLQLTVPEDAEYPTA